MTRTSFNDRQEIARPDGVLVRDASSSGKHADSIAGDPFEDGCNTIRGGR